MKFYRFAAEHKMLTGILLSVLLCALYSGFLFYLGASWILITIVDLLLVLLVGMWVSVCHTLLWKPALTANNDACDPYPLLAETEKQMSYRMSKANKQVLVINHCVALRNVGAYEKVYEMLTALHIDTYASQIPANKAVYYSNLADICTILEKYGEADAWHRKAVELYESLPEKQKSALQPAFATMQAAQHFRHGEYGKTVEILYTTKQATKNHQIDSALLCARAYLKLGNPQKAAEKLQYVIENGNLLYAVTEAKNILKTIEEQP